MIPVSKRWPAVALFAALFNAGPLWAAAVLENDYVLVSRDDAPCAQGSTPGCAERVIVAMGEVQLRFGKVLRAMRRGEVAVFKAGESYRPPTGGAFFDNPSNLLSNYNTEQAYDQLVQGQIWIEGFAEACFSQ